MKLQISFWCDDEHITTLSDCTCDPFKVGEQFSIGINEYRDNDKFSEQANKLLRLSNEELRNKWNRTKVLIVSKYTVLYTEENLVIIEYFVKPLTDAKSHKE